MQAPSLPLPPSSPFLTPPHFFPPSSSEPALRNKSRQVLDLQPKRDALGQNWEANVSLSNINHENHKSHQFHMNKKWFLWKLSQDNYPESLIPFGGTVVIVDEWLILSERGGSGSENDGLLHVRKGRRVERGCMIIKIQTCMYGQQMKGITIYSALTGMVLPLLSTTSMPTSTLFSVDRPLVFSKTPRSTVT